MPLSSNIIFFFGLTFSFKYKFQGSSIYGWHQWMRFVYPFFSHRLPILAKITPKLCKNMQNLTDDTSIHGWANIIHGWKCHPWMSSMDSVDSIHGWRNIILWWHPRMRITDDGHGQSNDRCPFILIWTIFLTLRHFLFSGKTILELQSKN